MSETICPVCEAGHLHAKTKKYEEEYHDHKGQVDLFYSECDVCGSEVPSEADLRAGRRALIRFRKEVDRLLSGEQIRAFRKRFNLTQALANQLFGGGAVAFSRYESDELMQSEQMDQLLRLCIEDPVNLRRIAERKGIKLPTPKATCAYETASLHLIQLAALESVGQATHELMWESISSFPASFTNFLSKGTASSKADTLSKSSFVLELQNAGTVQ